MLSLQMEEHVMRSSQIIQILISPSIALQTLLADFSGPSKVDSV